MGKGEIARYEQFLLFPQCFLKACFPEASKDVIVWEWVKVENVGKGQNAGYQHLFLCQQFFGKVSFLGLKNPELFSKGLTLYRRTKFETSQI